MRVWITRDEPRDGLLSTAVGDAGLEAVWEPVLERRVVGEAREEIARLGPEDWLVLTSAFAVEAVAGHHVCPVQVAVVGAVTERAARAHGFHVTLVSSGRSAGSLFAELRTRVRQGTICYPRSSLADVPKAWPGVELVCPVVYETRRRRFDRSVVERVDVVAVTSPSAVRAVGPLDLPFASIGPTTSEALQKIGCPPWVEADDRSFASLAEAIARAGLP